MYCFAQVVKRSEESPTVEISTTVPKDCEALLLARREKMPISIIEVGSSFFAYRPLLSALQKASKRIQLPLEHHLTGHSVKGHHQRPLYLEDETVYDLSFLIDPEIKDQHARSILAKVAVGEASSFPSETLYRYLYRN